MENNKLLDEIVETWHTNNRTNIFLIDQTSDEGMLCTLSARGGRNVVRQWAHVHNNRVWHLQKRAGDLAEQLRVFETDEEPDKKTLTAALKESAERLERFLCEAHQGEPKRRVFKKGLIAYLGYFIAHESHHRGNILLTLKQCGHGLDQTARMAIWNWDKL